MEIRGENAEVSGSVERYGKKSVSIVFDSI